LNQESKKITKQVVIEKKKITTKSSMNTTGELNKEDLISKKEKSNILSFNSKKYIVI